MNDNERALRHSDLLYDYIKFHLGLYLATPPLLAIVATALGVETNTAFQKGMVALVVMYFVAGAQASWTIAKHINTDWAGDSTWIAFGEKAKSRVRRCIHHYLYWLGLIFGLGGMGYAWIKL